MPVLPDKDEDIIELGIYELLGVSEDAGDKEINTAYRSRSKKVHPDKNPDDADAADKFDQLTRAKEFLLDPVRRAELDRKKHAVKELEARYAEQTGVRRKLREDLEAKEAAANLIKVGERAKVDKAEARKRFVQMDFAARIAERENKKNQAAADVAAEVDEVRVSVAEARLRVTPRAGSSEKVTAEAVREVLSSFKIRSFELEESCAIVQLESREDAIRAVLHCRERKHQLAFRVALATNSAKGEGGGSAGASQARAAARPASQPSPAAAPAAAPARAPAPAAPAAATKKKAGAAFGDWEADMLAGLMSAAKKQKAAKGPETP